MATQTIEQYFPKTAKYINSIFEKEGKERGGHHNYVIDQRCCNFSQTYGDTMVNSTKDTLEKADNDFLKYLKDLDTSNK